MDETAYPPPSDANAAHRARGIQRAQMGESEAHGLLDAEDGHADSDAANSGGPTSFGSPHVTLDNNMWVAYIPGLGLAVEESDLHTAITALIEAIREYATDFHHHLHAAPNHHTHTAFVAYVDARTDEQLQAWLIAAAAAR